MTRTLRVDIETFSSIDLPKCGVHRYVEAPDFAVILLQYRFSDWPAGQVRVVDTLQGEAVPEEFLDALLDPAIIKTAYNAAFERTCLGAWLGQYMPPEQWRCTAVMAAYYGLPGSLGAVCEALKAPQDRGKLNTGRALIRFFCIPCKPTKANGMRTRNLPRHDAERWRLFKEYGAQDVLAEEWVASRLDAKGGVPDFIWGEWCLDQRINERGVKIDRQLVEAAIELDKTRQAELRAEAIALTGLSNPNSVKQLLEWIEAATEGDDGFVAPPDLKKKTVAGLLAGVLPDKIEKLLRLRVEMAKSSTKKFGAMLRMASQRDDRIRGSVKFYGANRTGRFSGQGVQPQNFSSNKLPRGLLARLREDVRNKDAWAVSVLAGSVPYGLSETVRTAIIPEHDKCFAIIDYSAIEARVAAWLSGEEWVLEVFRTHGKIYEATASQMFGVPLSEFDRYKKETGKNHPMRQKGKVASLACQYGGSEGALINMGALEEGLQQHELRPLVDSWRAANARIVAYWYELDRAIKKALRNKSETFKAGKVSYQYRAGALFCRLPSGRELCYVNARLAEDGDVTYMGVDQKTRQWLELRQYGAKALEQITQAISRDLLVDAMPRVEQAGFPIVFHVHDELITEIPTEQADVALPTLKRILSTLPAWAAGLPLKGEGDTAPFYLKE